MAANRHRWIDVGSRSEAPTVTDLSVASDLSVTSLPPSVAKIAALWDILPPHIREAILTLVDAALAADRTVGALIGHKQESAPTSIDKAAWQIAKKCRHVIQGCLREEEWQDADQEFYKIIATGLPERFTQAHHRLESKNNQGHTATG